MKDFSGITPYQTRKTLIEKCKTKDEQAWLAFYEPYRNYARKIIQNKYYNVGSSCNELAHEVMVKVCRSIENFDPDMPSRSRPGERVKFRTWFFSQIRTVVSSFFEKKHKTEELFEFNPETDADIEGFDSRFHEEREQAIHAKAMELLTRSRTNKRNIEAFQMFLNDRTTAEIAAELEMPENSVYQAVCRCRRFLVERRGELEDLL